MKILNAITATGMHMGRVAWLRTSADGSPVRALKLRRTGTGLLVALLVYWGLPEELAPSLLDLLKALAE